MSNKVYMGANITETISRNYDVVMNTYRVPTLVSRRKSDWCVVMKKGGDHVN